MKKIKEFAEGVLNGISTVMATMQGTIIIGAVGAIITSLGGVSLTLLPMGKAIAAFAAAGAAVACGGICAVGVVCAAGLIGQDSYKSFVDLDSDYNNSKNISFVKGLGQAAMGVAIVAGSLWGMNKSWDYRSKLIATAPKQVQNEEQPKVNVRKININLNCDEDFNSKAIRMEDIGGGRLVPVAEKCNVVKNKPKIK